jgi:hypothetical protein
MAQIVIITYPHPSTRQTSSDLLEQQFQALLHPDIIEDAARNQNAHLETLPRSDSHDMAPVTRWISVYRIDGDEQLSTLIGRLNRSILRHYNKTNRSQLPNIPHGFISVVAKGDDGTETTYEWRSDQARIAMR